MQNDIIRLVEWANKGQLAFNTTICKLMHVGTYYPGKEYVMTKDKVNSKLATADLRKRSQS